MFIIGANPIPGIGGGGANPGIGGGGGPPIPGIGGGGGAPPIPGGGGGGGAPPIPGGGGGGGGPPIPGGGGGAGGGAPSIPGGGGGGGGGGAPPLGGGGGAPPADAGVLSGVISFNETPIVNGPLNSLFNFSRNFSASSAFVNFSFNKLSNLLFCSFNTAINSFLSPVNFLYSSNSSFAVSLFLI